MTQCRVLLKFVTLALCCQGISSGLMSIGHAQPGDRYNEVEDVEFFKVLVNKFDGANKIKKEAFEFEGNSTYFSGECVKQHIRKDGSVWGYVYFDRLLLRIGHEKVRGKTVFRLSHLSPNYGGAGYTNYTDAFWNENGDLTQETAISMNDSISGNAWNFFGTFTLRSSYVGGQPVYFVRHETAHYRDPNYIPPYEKLPLDDSTLYDGGTVELCYFNHKVQAPPGRQ